MQGVFPPSYFNVPRIGTRTKRKTFAKAFTNSLLLTAQPPRMPHVLPPEDDEVIDLTRWWDLWDLKWPKTRKRVAHGLPELRKRTFLPSVPNERTDLVQAL